jgi:amino acid transporter
MKERRLNLLQAVSLNMSLMVGIGPFITIPTLVGTMGGPQAMIGWIVGAVLAISDGMVWSELAALFPGSGGTYHFFDAAFGDSRPGRLLKFLFVWQFAFSAPLEVASAAIGLTMYLGYFFPILAEPAFLWQNILPGLGSPQALASATAVATATPDAIPPLAPMLVTYGQFAAMGVMVFATWLAYRRIEAIGRLMVVLWVGMLITVAWVILAGLFNFDPAKAFTFPPNAWRIDRHWVAGLGAAVAIAMYDFFGYYQICYLGQEVSNPGRVIPRSILISVVAVALFYLTMNIGILGVLPYQEVIASKFIASDFMLRISGPGATSVLTVFIIWTAFASLFAAIVGYSRVPYTSARAGGFFQYFAKPHPRDEFPHRGVVLIGGLSTLYCLADLATVIGTLITSRIVIQFVGQIVTLFYLRSVKRMPSAGFRMPLYPLPALVALLGWLFVFGTSEGRVILYALGSLGFGLIAFIVWDYSAGKTRRSIPHASDNRSLASQPEAE